MCLPLQIPRAGLAQDLSRCLSRALCGNSKQRHVRGVKVPVACGASALHYGS